MAEKEDHHITLHPVLLFLPVSGHGLTPRLTTPSQKKAAVHETAALFLCESVPYLATRSRSETASFTVTTRGLNASPRAEAFAM